MVVKREHAPGRPRGTTERPGGQGAAHRHPGLPLGSQPQLLLPLVTPPDDLRLTFKTPSGSRVLGCPGPISPISPLLGLPPDPAAGWALRDAHCQCPVIQPRPWPRPLLGLYAHHLKG